MVLLRDLEADEEAEAVPTPAGLVVKKGSKSRARASADTPGPVSETSSATWVVSGITNVPMVRRRGGGPPRMAWLALAIRCATSS